MLTAELPIFFLLPKNQTYLPFKRRKKSAFLPVTRRVFFLSNLAALHQAQEKNNRENLQLVVL
jgi:hypothetical protein